VGASCGWSRVRYRRQEQDACLVTCNGQSTNNDPRYSRFAAIKEYAIRVAVA